MDLICESNVITDYVVELDEVDFSNSAIQLKAAQLFDATQTEIEKVKIAFEFVRDDIAHSWDIQSNRITCKASDVLTHKEGICYAKSHLLAALLRSQNIPTGFCYQRLMLFDTPEKGYCIHALNAVYIAALDKWIRLDARGNKEGVNAQFSTDKEQLAFPVNEQLDEIDYPTIYVKPNAKTVATLTDNIEALEMYKFHLPTHL